MRIVYFKDRFLPENECHISIHDRSFRFGDGVFESLLVVGSVLYDFRAHQKRLQQGLKAFRIMINTDDLENICKELVYQNHLEQGHVRITVSRGEAAGNSVGYMPGNSTPYYIITTMEKPYPAFKPVRLFIASSHASFYTPAKTNNALIYVMALMEAGDNGCDNALLLDTNGHICETASGNIFWIKDNVLYTPAPDLPFIPGTMRSKVLQLWQGRRGEGHFGMEALINAEEIFMTNTGTILAPVTCIEPLAVHLGIGSHTEALRKQLDDAIRQV